MEELDPKTESLEALRDAIEAIKADDLRTAETCIADSLGIVKEWRNATGDVTE